MAIDIATFRARFDEFANDTVHPDAKIQIHLDDALIQCDETWWGNYHELGVMYLAAHEYALRLLESQAAAADENGQYGFHDGSPDVSQTADKLSYTKAVQSLDLSGGDGRLASTSYGLKYLEYRKLVGPVAFMVVQAEVDLDEIYS